VSIEYTDPTTHAEERCDRLPVAVRAWTDATGPNARQRRWKRKDASRSPVRSTGSNRSEQTAVNSRWRRSVLILDTETTTDATQCLTFGCYRIGEWVDDGTLAILEEGFFHADDLAERDAVGYAAFHAYTTGHEPETTGFYRSRTLMLRSRRDFLDHVLWPAVEADALIVGFNLPFDISRLAADYGKARKSYAGGFSFVLWEYEDTNTGKRRPHPFRPRVVVKHLDSKKALMRITRTRERGAGTRAKPWRGGLLDLRTLVFALTDRSYSLAAACDAFGVDRGKADTGEHGRITPEYVAYARQDVAATAALLVALRAEYDRHPLDLDPCKALSPASIAKAYLRAMGIRPVLERQPDFPRDVLGFAMSAYYGGRAECAIRKVPVPVVYTDVLSMYPTVNTLLELWRLLIADRVDVVDATTEANALLAGATLEQLLDPAAWRELNFFARVVPDGDVLPVRAQYGDGGGTWNIGINPTTDDAPHWYAGPDLAASVLLSGKAPTVLRALRLVPVGTQAGLRPVALRGAVPVDPTAGDFFRTVIEERKRTSTRAELPKEERARLVRCLKTLANAGSYGIFAQVDPQDLAEGESQPIRVYGPDGEPFTAHTTRPEQPGAFCFPPVAALITAGARLVLALIERLVMDAGGTHAFCDTDSMAMVATKDGGLVPCPGGPYRLLDGREAVKALSWAEVDTMVSRLDALNPYDRTAVPDTILKVEDINFDPQTGERRELWCYAISTKRYALYALGAARNPAIPPDGYKEHGLGHLLNPTDPDTDDPAWMRTLWEGIVREALGLPHEQPGWLDRPALVRYPITTPRLLDAFDTHNRGKSYAAQVKPFGFLLAAPLAKLGRPFDVDPADPLRLVAPFEQDARKWERLQWTDLYSGRRFALTSRTEAGIGVARVQTYRDVVTSYQHHPEPKRLGRDGRPCQRRTVGLLSRRPVAVLETVCVGKEAHRLEETAAGLVVAVEEVQTVYPIACWNSTRDGWTKVALPALRRLTAEPGGVTALADAAGLTAQHVRDVLSGRKHGRTGTRERLIAAGADAVRRCRDERIPQRGPAFRDTTVADLATLAAFAASAPERACRGCGVPLAGKRADARYCGEVCKSRAKRARKGTNQECSYLPSEEQSTGLEKLTGQPQPCPFGDVLRCRCSA
jgi:hypothetical protein